MRSEKLTRCGAWLALCLLVVWVAKACAAGVTVKSRANASNLP